MVNGDGILDGREQEVSILGGDMIAEVLCETMKPSRMVFLTDVPGILDQPPPNGSIVIPEIVVRKKADRSNTCTTPEGDEEEYEISIKLPETSMMEHDTTGTSL